MKMLRDASSLLYGDSNTTKNICIEKKLKLFGFEISEAIQQQQSLSPKIIYDTEGHEKFLLNDGGKESTNSSNTASSESHSDQPKNDITSSKNIEVEGVQNKLECQYCFKEFANSQALGGHQNAHKKERLKKKRLQLQAKKASLNFYLHQQPYNYNNYYQNNYNCDDISQSSKGTQQWYFDQSYNNNNDNMIYEESQISFGPFDQDHDHHHMPSFYQQQSTWTHASNNTCNYKPSIIKKNNNSKQNYCNKSLDLHLGLNLDSNFN